LGAELPLVVDIKHNSLDDGPGIRSVVFFKGCTLECVWCQNPEALSPHPEIQRQSAHCFACGSCVPACPQGVARPAAQPEKRDACSLCGACVEACPAGARRLAGTRFEPEELAGILSRDEPFYRHSGGGVTFSGGEPAMYPELPGAVARLLKEKNIHVLLETAGHFDWDSFASHLLPHLSTIYFDLKIADEDQHRRHVGQGNRRILDNLRRLVDEGFEDLLPRIPLIPGITDSPENLRALAGHIREVGLERVMILPYNPLWHAKRRDLGLPLPYHHDSFMSQESVQVCMSVVERSGLLLG
jgi:pyruvate formate lyase activating enzyme